MAQPKDPPLSVRLGGALQVRLDAWIAENGLTRNAAIKLLVLYALNRLQEQTRDPRNVL